MAGDKNALGYDPFMHGSSKSKSWAIKSSVCSKPHGTGIPHIWYIPLSQLVIVASYVFPVINPPLFSWKMSGSKKVF